MPMYRSTYCACHSAALSNSEMEGGMWAVMYTVSPPRFASPSTPSSHWNCPAGSGSAVESGWCFTEYSTVFSATTTILLVTAVA